MDSEQRQILLERIGAGLLVVAFAVGAWFLNQYEQARSRDIQRMSRVLETQSMFGAYASRYAIFPPAVEGSMLLGVTGADCMSKAGITDRSADGCKEGFIGYLSPLGSDGENAFMAYATFGADRKSICASQNGCQWYTIQFEFETNAVASKGVHIVTPEGFAF
ncbi:hypothetical protein HY622_02680 [Candidatus Uhrbacteria bacterium]|nr:hypothetical protein [Candidatus Uhrbacteria bacterium]